MITTAAVSPRDDGDAEWVLLCEGYHDRAFLAGLLESRGLVSLQNDARFRGRGHFGYRGTNAYIRIVPCETQSGSEQGVWSQALVQLKRRRTDPLRGLVLVLDEDLARSDKAASAREAGSRARERLRRLAERAGDTADEGAPMGSLQNQVTLADGTRLFAVAWACDDAASSLLPAVQCLERLVAAAINAAYPRRGDQVGAWLAGREAPPTDAAAANKAYAWSHMAGWYADRGCDAFLRSLWSEPEIGGALKERLRQSASWEVLEKIITEQ